MWADLWLWCCGVLQSEKEKLEASDRQLKKMQKRLREEELKLLRGEQVRPQALLTHQRSHHLSSGFLRVFWYRASPPVLLIEAQHLVAV